MPTTTSTSTPTPAPTPISLPATRSRAQDRVSFAQAGRVARSFMYWRHVSGHGFIRWGLEVAPKAGVTPPHRHNRRANTPKPVHLMTPLGGSGRANVQPQSRVLSCHALSGPECCKRRTGTRTWTESCSSTTSNPSSARITSCP